MDSKIKKKRFPVQAFSPDEFDAGEFGSKDGVETPEVELLPTGFTVSKALSGVKESMKKMPKAGKSLGQTLFENKEAVAALGGILGDVLPMTDGKAAVEAVNAMPDSDEPAPVKKPAFKMKTLKAKASVQSIDDFVKEHGVYGESMVVGAMAKEIEAMAMNNVDLSKGASTAKVTKIEKDNDGNLTVHSVVTPKKPADHVEVTVDLVGGAGSEDVLPTSDMSVPTSEATEEDFPAESKPCILCEHYTLADFPVAGIFKAPVCLVGVPKKTFKAKLVGDKYGGMVACDMWKLKD